MREPAAEPANVSPLPSSAIYPPHNGRWRDGSAVGRLGLVALLEADEQGLERARERGLVT